jgi:hypothetical protein
MAILSKDTLLGGSDLIEREIEIPSLGGSVRVRSLPAAYSNQAQSEALELVNLPSGGQTAHVNTAKAEELQVLHGLVAPQLGSIEEARTLSHRYGIAWRKIVDAIDEISGIDKDAIERVNATFRSGDGGAGDAAESGSGTGDRDQPPAEVDAGAGDHGSTVPVRTGA